ncbi:oligosaccharide flippase family protein [Clostridium estertheticum]|uniref:Oligosaccharide flippase family protein n=1 Tax=Clostridium estertheticum TaxID=238834 RepID=A0A7Y3WTN2_9CLOT|nr:oligosaccharide flippase family protein [Clostridium estertheticum]NNU77311.1 oligosaccharide flippase family protein [Clostridium estertheticum]WBL47047.1 oligosaccharide flippase family protein [Clostridium estertheticum]
MNLKEKILKGISWTIIGTLITQVTTFILVFFMARILGNVNYGKFNIILSTVVSLSTIAGAGLGITATKFIAQYKEDYSKKEKLGKILGISYFTANILSIGFTLILFILSDYIAMKIFKDKDLIVQLKYASIYVFFFTVNGYQVGALTGFERFNDIAKIYALKGIINMLSGFSLIYLWGISGAAASMVVTAISTYLYSRMLLNKQMKIYNLKFILKGSLEELNILLIFTLPAALVGIVGAIATWFSNQLLVNNSYDRFVSMSVFSLSSTFKALIIFFPAIIARVISPILVSMKFTDYNKYKKLFNLNLIINASVTTIMAIIVIVINPIILKIVGKGYDGIQPVIVLLGLSAIVETVSSCLFQEIYIYNKIWHNLFCTIIWSIILVSLTGLFAKNLGAISLAIAYLSANVFQMLFYLIVLIRNRKKTHLVSELRSEQIEQVIN